MGGLNHSEPLMTVTEVCGYAGVLGAGLAYIAGEDPIRWGVTACLSLFAVYTLLMAWIFILVTLNSVVTWFVGRIRGTRSGSEGDT